MYIRIRNYWLLMNTTCFPMDFNTMRLAVDASYQRALYCNHLFLSTSPSQNCDGEIKKMFSST